MDVINAIPDKPTRGLAKAGLVRAKRTGETPPMPEKPAVDSITPLGTLMNFVNTPDECELQRDITIVLE